MDPVSGSCEERDPTVQFAEKDPMAQYKGKDHTDQYDEKDHMDPSYEKDHMDPSYVKDPTAVSHEGTQQPVVQDVAPPHCILEDIQNRHGQISTRYNIDIFNSRIVQKCLLENFANLLSLFFFYCKLNKLLSITF